MKKKSELYINMRNETYYSREEMSKIISADYIRGLVEGAGYFGMMSDRRGGNKIPAFVLKMHIRDKELIESVRDFLELRNRVYEYDYSEKKPNGRSFAVLQIRDIYDLRNTIVPFFRKKLLGYRGSQMEEWLKAFPYLVK